MNWLKAIGRMFTIPAKIRTKIDANPLAPVVKTALQSELSTVISTAVSHNVSDPAMQLAVTAALNHAVQSTGVFN